MFVVNKPFNEWSILNFPKEKESPNPRVVISNNVDSCYTHTFWHDGCWMLGWQDYSTTPLKPERPLLAFQPKVRKPDLCSGTEAEESFHQWLIRNTRRSYDSSQICYQREKDTAAHPDSFRELQEKTKMFCFQTKLSCYLLPFSPWRRLKKSYSQAKCYLSCNMDNWYHMYLYEPEKQFLMWMSRSHVVLTKPLITKGLHFLLISKVVWREKTGKYEWTVNRYNDTPHVQQSSSKQISLSMMLKAVRGSHLRA